MKSALATSFPSYFDRLLPAESLRHMTSTWTYLEEPWLPLNSVQQLGWNSEQHQVTSESLRNYLHLQMAAQGLPTPAEALGALQIGLADGLLANLQEKNRLLATNRPAVDMRILAFLREHLKDVASDRSIELPMNSFTLDRHGMARELSLPYSGDQYENSLLSSYRVHNGVLHNPRNDRRTTEGTFHIAEGGLPIPDDKKAVPKRVFSRLLQESLQPPEALLELPYMSGQNKPARSFVSLLVRPIVCPSVEGFCRHKSMEVRFFAPGSLVANLDFVESIFGNAGDPLVPENDAGLDVLYWSGQTGCVILAPHLTQLSKRDLGLPSWQDATERQRRDKMCWKDPAETYNDGVPFKITCRTEQGVIVTLIADNYFGYCKKEVKTQISFAANLLGNVEEEHAGGAMAFPSFALGDEFQLNSQRYNGRTFDDVARYYGQLIDVSPEGYGIDRVFSNLVYVPENAKASLNDQYIRWTRHGQQQSLRIEPGKVYMAPSGYKLVMEKHPAAPSWRLIGTSGDGILCHKPCTVSGGGKSEISKSLRNYKLSGPFFVADLNRDFDWIDQIFSRDFSNRWKDDATGKPDYSKRSSRPILDTRRSLGSVIKLLTPSREYTDEYNAWLRTIPSHIYAMAFIIKRFYKPDWEGQWRKFFSVDVVNGEPGHELKFGNRKLVGMYLRVGLDQEGRWRTYKLRQDFAAAAKIQMEDDITASVVVPGRFLSDMPNVDPDLSYKFVANCEYRLFQRPDDAIHRGLDRQTEADIARRDNFLCNFEPLSREQAETLAADVMDFDRYTQPIQTLVHDFLDSDNALLSVSSHPRIVNGKPSKNPRYLQNRPDLELPFEKYVALRGLRLYRATKLDQPVHLPVTSILSGRRNNPPDLESKIRGLAVYNPIHYQELPELLMDYVCSLTGKSPSTTGAGSEGALTKGPFNALMPTLDLNASVVSLILTGLGGYSTAAGHVGPEFEVEHDISLLVPEIWCRMSPQERDPNFLIQDGMLEKIEDFEYEGKTILASRLGYRITARFVRYFFGRVFDNPSKVFDERILCPERQDLPAFVDGVEHIVEAQRRVAEQYFRDGSFEQACPPLQAVLACMVHGNWNGKSIRDPEVRAMFSRDAMLHSDWYQARLAAKQKADLSLWKRHSDYLNDYLHRKTHQAVIQKLELHKQLAEASRRLEFCASEAYLQRIQGTLGLDPSLVAN